MADPPDLRIAVLQPGARLHYAVPTLLQRAGMLHRLYTDCTNVGLTRQLEYVWPHALQPVSVRRLLGRKLPAEVPHSKVRQVRAAVVREQFARAFGGTAERTSSAALMSLARSERFGGANTIYTVLVNEDLELCRSAKENGLKIVHEAMSTPDIGLVRHAEYARFGGPERGSSLNEIHAGRDRDRQKYAVADLILVPSNFVRDEVLALGAEASQVVVVPYGIDDRWLSLPASPIQGRVLFVGRVGLLKGNHYLAEAARVLAQRRVACDVRVVGPLGKDVSKEQIYAGPTYLGQVPRSEIHEEYSAADIFVLPSLSEGMAIVTLEAMAAGLPVVTTPNAGSCVRDGIDGFVVPARDAKALACAIEKLLTDRVLRETMSRNARERAAEFTWEKYEGRLINALARLSAPPPLGRVTAPDLTIGGSR